MRRPRPVGGHHHASVGSAAACRAFSASAAFTSACSVSRKQERKVSTAALMSVARQGSSPCRQAGKQADKWVRVWQAGRQINGRELGRQASTQTGRGGAVTVVPSEPRPPVSPEACGQGARCLLVHELPCSCKTAATGGWSACSGSSRPGQLAQHSNVQREALKQARQGRGQERRPLVLPVLPPRCRC